jgi:serine/threonine protein phosphatase PrpC
MISIHYTTFHYRSSQVEIQSAPVFSRYAAVSKVGFVPFNPHKVNQDRACKVLNFANDEEKVFFGVFDGHGSVGHDVSQFVSSKLPGFLMKEKTLESDPAQALSDAFVACNTAMVKSSGIDCTFSGTTAIVCYIQGMCGSVYSCICVYIYICHARMYHTHTRRQEALLGQLRRQQSRAWQGSQWKTDRDPSVKRPEALSVWLCAYVCVCV